MPGEGERPVIDPHVHLRDWNQKEKETIFHGLLIGSMCGIDTFFDMPNTNPPLTSLEAIGRRLADGEAAAEAISRNSGKTLSYHVYGGLTPERNQIQEMVEAYNLLFPRVCGLKLFAGQSTGNMGVVEKENQKAIYQALTELGYKGVVAVHSEKESYFDKSQKEHSLVRPPVSEVESVRDQIEAIEETGFQGTLHIAHISTEGALELVKDAKKRGLKVTCGATPHHLLKNSGDATMWAKMNPPLRPESDRKAIWNGLFDGSVDWVESDHAPHTVENKEQGASGIPGFEGTLLLIKKLREEGMEEKRLNELFSENVFKAFGMEDKKSSPVPAFDNDILKSVHSAYPFSAW
ncbi:MAG: dihydroorotase [Spirochaetales bacterium]|nr:dihydroorotase [Candidatus Physcosoma equi]